MIHLMGLRKSGRMSPRTKVGAKWLSKIKKTQVAHNDSITMSVGHLSPLGSQLSFSNALRIDTVVDWDEVRRKYRALFGDEMEKIIDDNQEMPDTEQITIIEETGGPLPITNVII